MKVACIILRGVMGNETVMSTVGTVHSLFLCWWKIRGKREKTSHTAGLIFPPFLPPVELSFNNIPLVMQPLQLKKQFSPMYNVQHFFLPQLQKSLSHWDEKKHLVKCLIAYVK